MSEVVLQSVKNGTEKFGLELYRLVREDGPRRDNICISPCSLFVALCMILKGSQGNTEKQILKALHFQNLSSDDIHGAVKAQLDSVTKNGSVQIANSVFFKTGLTTNDQFDQTIRNLYGGTIKFLDFSGSPYDSTKSINEWVSNATKGKITEVSSSVDPLTIMMLINAVYFKSKWETPFDRDYTKPMKFNLDKTSSIFVNMMDLSGDFMYTLDTKAQCQVLKLPYADQTTSMLIFLPKDIEGLPQIESVLTPTFVNEILSKLHIEMDLLVRLPSFKIESSYALNPVLNKMGMTDMFDSQKANLERICDNKSIRITNIHQKTFIEVNEEGTEAAAVSVCVSDGIGGSMPPRFIANRPFLFLIYCEKNLLFMGRIMAPERILPEKDEQSSEEDSDY